MITTVLTAFVLSAGISEPSPAEPLSSEISAEIHARARFLWSFGVPTFSLGAASVLTGALTAQDAITAVGIALLAIGAATTLAAVGASMELAHHLDVSLAMSPLAMTLRF